MYIKYYRYICILMIAYTLVFTPDICGQIYTPQGSYVPVFQNSERYSSAEKEALRQEYAKTYPKVIYMDEATSTYNCHAYAWSMSEGGEVCWMNSPSDDIYITDGSYILTSSTDPKARKVSYGNDNHSAIVPFSNSTYLISKWGSACLMKHRYNDCPYNSTNVKYYKLSMEIIGDDVVALPSNTATETKTYTLSNVPDGATVEWNVTGRTTIVSGQGSNSIQVRINGTGNSTISAKVRCNTGLVVNIPYNLYVKASAAPIVTDIELFKYGQSSGEFTMKVITNMPEGYFSWSVYGGHAELYEIPYPDDASFAQYPNCYKAIRFYEKGVYTITVQSSKSGTTDTYIYNKDFNISETAN